MIDHDSAQVTLAWLAAIVESSNEAIIGKTLDEVITSWNPAAERMYGYSAREAVGKRIGIIIPPDRAHELGSIMERLARGERIPPYETVQVRKDGGRVDVSISVSPVTNGAGQIVGASTIARDITERKQMERALRERDAQLRVLFESNIIGIVLGGAEEALEANDAFLNMIGYTREDLRAGKIRWLEMTVPEYRHRDEQARQEMLTRGACAAYEKEYVRRGGSRVPVLIAGALLERSPLRTISFVLNLTASKEMEEQHVRLNRQKDAFVEAVAHDLKTPLTKIKGQAQLLQLRLDRSDAVDVEQFRKALKQIDATATRLTAQINGLLDVTRIEQGNALELTLRSVDLKTLVDRVAVEQQEHTTSHRITVESGSSSLVTMADEMRLERVVTNLLSNAIMYSPDGGTIAVKVAAEGDGVRRRAVLTVKDEGIGIPAEDLPLVFERFHRGRNVAGRIPGNGVGLAGAKQIVEQHGGTISVESREGEGSIFTVRLPLMPGA